MTRKEYERDFRANVLPYVRAAYEPDGRVDAIARREEWITHIDGLVKDGELPARAINWTCPW